MNRWIRWATVVAVAAVAGVAGWVSYQHAVAVVTANGEHGMVGRVYPATTDGLIFAASMVLLDAARRKVPAPVLARWLLGVGIAATLFANVLAGYSYGPLGAVVAAWPALALVGSYELLMLLVRAAGTAKKDVPSQVPSIRELKAALGVGQDAAAKFQAYLSNGHSHERGPQVVRDGLVQPD